MQVLGLEWDSSNVIATRIKNRVSGKIKDHLEQTRLIYLNEMYPL